MTWVVPSLGILEEGHCSSPRSTISHTQSVAQLDLSASQMSRGLSHSTTNSSGSNLESLNPTPNNKNKWCQKYACKPDRKANFMLWDYQNICSYVKDEDNDNNLFEKTSRTNIEKKFIT
ncbi:hypothetical protein O181_015049 [Austropuccinia psidii MF-1]|uniref:Uncharacterized protein n=1 Tax=Austropuccinia psidii MF-1 TaxID=1389203 RepID=A0A9Q3BZ98_9BASI|nr:hypothetical protein [Austropuccinia psidii MF-1]